MALLHMDHFSPKNKPTGFTLIEVLLVIVVIGLMVAAIQMNFGSNKPEEKLHQEARRFASVFNVAAEYGLLNNIELGLSIDKNTYQFIGYDGVRWSPIADNDFMSRYELPEGVDIALVFDDLPLEQTSLIDADLFTPDDETLAEMAEGLSDDEKPLIPQVYLLSGGDITPFRLEFSYDQTTKDIDEIMFAVTGLYTTPLSVSGPYIDGINVGVKGIGEEGADE